MSTHTADPRATPTRADVHPPVRAWAAVGAAFIVFAAYLLGRWLTGSAATSIRVGEESAPTWIHAVVNVHLVLGPVALVAATWWFLIRPWRAVGRPTSDGLLMVACLTTYWGNLASNYFHIWLAFPTVWPNLGSWYGFVPGWSSGAGNLQPEAIAFFVPMYGACMFGFSSIGIAVMRRRQAANPTISKVRLFVAAWIVMAGIDLVLEVVWVRLGLFIYPSTIKSLTLFAGHYYQFPVYEAVIWGFGWAVLASVRFFRNDHDETIVERGATDLPGGNRKKIVYRLLALCAVANLNLLAYNVVAGLIAIHNDPVPADITDRPYMVGALCTPDSPDLCPNDPIAAP